MRAAVYDRFGGPEVVEVRDLPRPVPLHDEILIRVHASTVEAADRRIRSRDVPRGFGLVVRLLFGWSRPTRPILGTVAAGVIEEVGRSVTAFSPGQAVVAFMGTQLGGHAELVRVKAGSVVAPMPEELSFVDAAALCFGGTTALRFLRSAQPKPGERVLVNGASGAVGSAAVQLAKHAGAHVTAVCSATNVELVRGLGADEVIDYAQRDFAQSDERYDVIVDAVGNAPFARSRSALRPGGRLLAVVASLPEMLHAPWVGWTTDARVVTSTPPERAEDLRELVRLALEGHLRPVIGGRFPLESIVEAHRLVDGGHKRGSVVVNVLDAGGRAPFEAGAASGPS